MMSEKAFVPLYRKIYTDLKNKMEEGVYRAGEKLPYERELCEMYGVKRVTKGSGQSYTVEFESGVDVRRGVFNALSKANCPILMMRPGGMTLEESFLKLTEGGED